MTAINVTHDQDEAMSMSDRIMILRDGKVQQSGTPTELYLHPGNIFVASFMGAANMLAGEIVKDASSASGTDVVMLCLDKELAESRTVLGRLNDNVRDNLNGRARLLVRPEVIRVYQEAREFNHSNVFQGKVLHTSFVGGQWRTLVTIDELHLKPVLAFPTFEPHIEQRLWLELPPEQCQIVPE